MYSSEEQSFVFKDGGVTSDFRSACLVFRRLVGILVE